MVAHLLHADADNGGNGGDTDGGGKIAPGGRPPSPYPPLPEYPPLNPCCPLGEVKVRACLPVIIPQDDAISENGRIDF